MRKGFCFRLLLSFAMFLLGLSVHCKILNNEVCFNLQKSALAQDEIGLDDFDFDDEIMPELTISDPLEPINRLFFHFNDKLYFWALKPVSRVYGAVVPKPCRISIRNFFHNLFAPIRIVNNVLQGKFTNAGVEFNRFLLNTTVGVAGLGDPAKNKFGLDIKDEDLGQTLGYYGIGNGIYFCWPILGPSTARDTLGLAGDSFLNPLTYLGQSDPDAQIAAYAVKYVNNTSLVIGDYESFKESSFDPYISLRDAYIQHRHSKVNDKNNSDTVY